MVLRNSLTQVQQLLSLAREALIASHKLGKGMYEAESSVRIILTHEGAIKHDEVGTLITCNDEFVQFQCSHVTIQSMDPPVVTVHEDGTWERV